MITTPEFDAATHKARSLRAGLETKLRGILSPELAAEVLGDIQDYVDASRRVVAVVAGEMLTTKR
jgi:hypothetical protein